MVRYFSIFFIYFFTISLSAVCTNPDKQHCDQHIVNCPYTQEDIYRGFGTKNTRCYQCEERRKQCFYCGCPIDQHTKNEVEKVAKRCGKRK